MSRHFPLLGFDALKNERGEYTDIYAPNKAELQQVEWVMTSFLNVDRYNVLLDRCKEKGITTKLGKDFTRKSIRTLLTNPRYIGKWYRNKHNAGKRQSKLMPYERYAEVDLGHGCVIDKALWLRVQGKVKELDESRTRATKHCYPLSGLLVFSDGSHFIGSSAWGETRRSTYYHNMSNKIRVRSEVFDTEAAKILLQIAEDSRAFQKNIADYSTRKESSIGMVSSKIAEIDTKLGEIEADKRQLDKRLNFLLEDDDLEMARSFKDEYRSRFLALKNDEQVLIDRKRKLQQLQQQLTKKQEPTRSASGSLDLPPLSSSNTNEWLGHTHEAINYIKKKDWLSLKSTYRQLFKKIIVQPLNSERVQLEFVFNNPSTPENSGVDIFCVSGDRAPFEVQNTESVLNPDFSIKSITSIASAHIPASVLKEKYLDDLLSTREIAKEFSCSKTRIRDLLRKHNIPLRNRSARYGSRWLAYGKRRVSSKVIDHKGELRTIATIKQMYAEGMSIATIARCLDTMKIPTRRQGKGWDYHTVTAILKREGVYNKGRKRRTALSILPSRRLVTS